MIEHDRYLSRAARQMQESAIRKMGAVGARIPDLVSFAPGSPAPELFPWAELREIADRLLDSREPNVLQYGGTRGFRPLVELLVGVMAERGIRARADEIIVTTGSQQGIDLLGRILADPGDVMLVELPAYAGAITAFRNAQARLVGIRQQPDGIDLEHLEHVVRRERHDGHRIAGLYVTPNFQNPTGLLMSQLKRRRLLDWAASRDVLLIEDDPYGTLYFDEQTGVDETRPIKADDDGGQVIYLSSFSKTLAPGLRVAWLSAHPTIAEKMETIKQAADLCTGILDQRIVHEAVRLGIVTSRLPELRQRYRQKRDTMERALETELGSLVTWSPARGGFFLWLTLPEHFDADCLLERALAARVSYVTGSAFFVEALEPRLVRLSFSAPGIERIEEGVRRFASAIRDEMAVISAASSGQT